MVGLASGPGIRISKKNYGHWGAVGLVHPFDSGTITYTLVLVGHPFDSVSHQEIPSGTRLRRLPLLL